MHDALSFKHPLPFSLSAKKRLLGLTLRVAKWLSFHRCNALVVKREEHMEVSYNGGTPKSPTVDNTWSYCSSIETHGFYGPSLRSPNATTILKKNIIHKRCPYKLLNRRIIYSCVAVTGGWTLVFNHSLSNAFSLWIPIRSCCWSSVMFFFATWNPNLCWLIVQTHWLDHVESFLPVNSPLLPGEKLEGVQDALKGFRTANGVLWFHQEAGCWEEGMDFFLGQNNLWMVDGWMLHVFERRSCRDWW